MTIEQRMEFVLHLIESHDRQIREWTAAVNQLVNVSNQDENTIRSLSRIAEAYENRIFDIEQR